jgi:hypothetical protein
MPNKEDMRWFKQNFQSKIEEAIKGTPFTVDLMTALACQETGEVWPILRRKPGLSVDRILELCVGDTIDSSGGRGVFPRTKAELVSRPKGQQMFDIARAALEDMASFIPSYKKVLPNKDKFCHGFGIFQYDIQFFENDDPDYFLERRYVNFDNSLGKAIMELRHAQNGIGFKNKTSLTDLQQAFVAIAYNIGSGNFDASKGLKQGFTSDDGKRYGEQIFEFIKMSKTVQVDGASTAAAAAAAATASVATPAPATATGSFLQVEVKTSPLNLRTEPKIDKNNVIARLPDGHIVRAISDTPSNGFLEVETDLLGEHLRGFAAAQFLKPAASPAEEVV